MFSNTVIQIVRICETTFANSEQKLFIAICTMDADGVTSSKRTMDN